jgi:putative ATPase
VGVADNGALAVAIDAFRALEVVGLPEANFALSHAAVSLALSPKSDSIKRAMGEAMNLVESGPHAEVPSHLRSGSTAGDRELGYGVGYVYPHADPRGVVPQQYLPEGLEAVTVFRPKAIGDEMALAERLARIDVILGKSSRRVDP